ncbi:Anaphase promoting complex subunit 8 / Cdc23 [Popillia japonica]|uniref:Anaphase promoting complex subunit 8 / Cdc23 n=1 Tax=Popillia japonica TaxID=7064 RepID=A0AAW1LR36_POPJA
MDTSSEDKLDLQLLKVDLTEGIRACSERGLYHCTKWLAELNFAISHIKLAEEQSKFTETYDNEYDAYCIAKSYFDVKEYDRCAHYTKNCENPKPRFLHLYSRYLSIEKKKLDNMTDANCPPDPTKNTALKDLCAILMEDYNRKKLDGYCLYLYGVILKKLDLTNLAIDVFVESVNAVPILWAAWQELAQLVPNKNKLNSLILPNHWIKQFFLAYAYLEQLSNDESLEIYTKLHDQGFNKSSFLIAQTAIVYHNRRELEKAIETFKELISEDPYRLDNLDTYSNLLYVREMKSELADLAHTAVSIDKYRVETCCIIGNYYSIRSDHAKAVLYFQRALKLNPHYLSAWTLMGHEFMEMKNTNAAIQSYRHAIEINPRDYRAWYGLGQTYEILKMPYYCMHYYKQAQHLRPTDSRMIIALGETYEKLDKVENALKCYYKARNVGDIEGMALVKLGNLYHKLKLFDNAAAAYTEYCLKLDEQKATTYEDQIEYYNAFQYLANYHLNKGELDEAYTYANKCLENEQTKEGGKALLKTIAAKRGEQENVEVVPMDETGTFNLPDQYDPCLTRTAKVYSRYFFAKTIGLLLTLLFVICLVVLKLYSETKRVWYSVWFFISVFSFSDLYLTCQLFFGCTQKPNDYWMVTASLVSGAVGIVIFITVIIKYCSNCIPSMSKRIFKDFKFKDNNIINRRIPPEGNPGGNTVTQAEQTTVLMEDNDSGGPQ